MWYRHDLITKISFGVNQEDNVSVDTATWCCVSYKLIKINVEMQSIHTKMPEHYKNGKRDIIQN